MSSVLVKRDNLKQMSVPDLGDNDSPDASSSQVENEQPQENDRDHATKKIRRQMRNGGRRKGKGKGKQTTNLGESSYNSDMYINREIFTTKHE